MKSQYNGQTAYQFIIFKGNAGEELKVMSKWTDMPFDIYHRWMWYFRYRAALYQVQEPKAYITTMYGVQKDNIKKTTADKFLQNKIVKAKANISRFENKLTRFRNSYSELFPIEEHETFIKLNIRIDGYKTRLSLLQKELKNK